MKLTILKTACLAACIPASSTATVLAVALSPTLQLEKEIPPELLKIDNTGNLLGFKDNVTVDQIRNGNYTTLKIPDNVITINDYAFAFMFDNMSTNVTNLVLNNNLKFIRHGAFHSCYGLMGSINFKDTQIREIGNDAFNYCSGLTGALEFPEQTLVSIGTCAFKDCNGLTKITIPESVTFIGDYAFDGCINVGEVYTWAISANATNTKQMLPPWLLRKTYCFLRLGEAVESDTDEPNKLIWIKDLTFSEDEWLNLLHTNTSISQDFKLTCNKTIPEDKLDIDNNVLKGFAPNIDLSKYNYLRIPDGVTSIDNNAFDDKIKDCFIHIKLDDDLTSIGSKAFNLCTGIIGQVDIPEKVSEIGANAFAGCSNITGSIVIPTATTTINEQTFDGCTNLQRISLHAEITEVKGKAFYNCAHLHEIDMTRMNSGDKIPWTKVADNPQFGGLPKYGTLYYPFNETFSVLDDPQNGYFYPQLKNDLGFDNINNWVRTMNPKHGEVFPYHPDNPQEGKAYYMSGTELVGLRPKLRDDWDLNKTDYQIIDIPDNTTKIRVNAFKDQFKLGDSISLESTNWKLELNYGLGEIAESAFEGNDCITGNVILPDSLTKLGGNAFKGCGNITYVKVPSSLENVSGNVFNGCSNLHILDFRDFTKIPGSGWADTAFANIGGGNGVVYVNSQADTNEWNLFLSSHGAGSWIAQKA